MQTLVQYRANTNVGTRVQGYMPYKYWYDMRHCDNVGMYCTNHMQIQLKQKKQYNSIPIASKELEFSSRFNKSCTNHLKMFDKYCEDPYFEENDDESYINSI